MKKPIILTRNDLQNSKTLPGKIRSYLITKIGRYQVKYVEWDAKVRYPDHTDLEEAYIFMIEGNISTGPLTLTERMAVKFHRDFHQRDMRTNRGARFILIRPRLKYEKRSGSVPDTLSFSDLHWQNLQKSERYAKDIRFGRVATINRYVVDYVTWKAGTVYPDHVNLSNAHIHLINGEIRDGDWCFKANSTVTFPKGFHHARERAAKDAEFILIWGGYPSIRSVSRK